MSECYSRFDVIIKHFGVSQDPLTKEYMLVMEYAEGGDLHNYLQKNFVNITWMEKLKILQNISEGLHAIHKENVVHRDFHSRNILLKYSDTGNLWKIGDLGLSQPLNGTPNNEIYGVIRYIGHIAPEVFRGSKFTKESDIYSMSMIMWELTIGCRPFDNVKHDIHLVYMILDGVRPKITKDTPEYFTNLMKRCWDSDPSKRPIIFEIFEWCNYSYTTNSELFKQAEEKRLELIKLKILGPENSVKRLSALISSYSPISCYNSEELGFDIDTESQNNELTPNEDIFQIPSSANNDFTTQDTQQDTSISTSRKHNIEELNIENQNDGKRIKADDAD